MIEAILVKDGVVVNRAVFKDDKSLFPGWIIHPTASIGDKFDGSKIIAAEPTVIDPVDPDYVKPVFATAAMSIDEARMVTKSNIMSYCKKKNGPYLKMTPVDTERVRANVVVYKKHVEQMKTSPTVAATLKYNFSEGWV